MLSILTTPILLTTFLPLVAAPYQYREVDPYKKPADLLALNPKGLVPALKLGEGKGLAESTVM